MNKEESPDARAKRLKEIAVLLERVSDATLNSPGKARRRNPSAEGRVAVFVENGAVTVISDTGKLRKSAQTSNDGPKAPTYDTPYWTLDYDDFASYEGYSYEDGLAPGDDTLESGSSSQEYGDYSGYDGYGEGYDAWGYGDGPSGYGMSDNAYGTYKIWDPDGYQTYDDYDASVDYGGYGLNSRRPRGNADVHVIQVSPSGHTVVLNGADAEKQARRFIR